MHEKFILLITINKHDDNNNNDNNIHDCRASQLSARIDNKPKVRLTTRSTFIILYIINTYGTVFYFRFISSLTFARDCVVLPGA